jgi:ABC-2 type transport system ATP-binding protein
MLQFQNLHKEFGSIVAVDDLSFNIENGEVFGLLGPNGAGKTTTVNMAIGLIKPDRGSVKIEGSGSPMLPEARAKIGVAPQVLAIYEELTGWENLAFFGKMQGLAGRRLKDRINWALDFVGLSERKDQRVAAYSGGMKRRLNLAVALIHNPPILLLDEPTVGVDPQSRNAIFEKIEILREEGCTIVYTTHYMEEAQRLCKRVGIIDRGKLLALDTVDNLIKTHGGPGMVVAETADGEVRIETDDPVQELNRLQQKETLLHFRVDYPDLEAVFLNLTGRKLRD